MRANEFPLRSLAFLAVLNVAACAPPAPAPEAAPPVAQTAPITPAQTEAVSGAYTLDKTHTSLLFRVNHLGFSNYTGRFARFDAALTLDTAAPEKSQLSATVDAASLALENPPRGFLEELLGAQWLDARKHSTMSFKSTSITLTSPNTGKVVGDFTMRGVTRPLTLDVTLNGGYRGHPMDPNARIGFSAQGVLKRSEYGVTYGIPAPGTTMGVSDDVQVIIEAEFSGPALPPEAKTAAP